MIFVGSVLRCAKCDRALKIIDIKISKGPLDEDQVLHYIVEPCECQEKEKQLLRSEKKLLEAEVEARR